MKFDPAEAIRKTTFDHDGTGVNPSVSDSSTYTFPSAATMSDTFEGKNDNFLYSRHSSPSNSQLERALAAMEGAEAACVTASGMAAITSVLLQICEVGDHIVASRTLYGGTYAFLKNFATRCGIETTFVDFTNSELVREAIQPNTKLLYCESVSNPLLEVCDIVQLAQISKEFEVKFAVDNTFSPLCLSPILLGADIVIHSLTKYINGSSDAIGGAICSSSDFIASLRDVNSGAVMLLGPTMDSHRASAILKNLATLHLRMQQHGRNALFLAQQFEKLGIRTVYPGLENHAGNALFRAMQNPEFGFGGVLTIDAGSYKKAQSMLELMQQKKLGYIAVSLGFHKTLFIAPGSSTSSEIPADVQLEMGLTDSLIRFSIGIDNDISQTWKLMHECLETAGVLSMTPAR